MKTLLKRLSLSMALACSAGMGAAQANVLEGTDVDFSGYIKLDAMLTDYSDGSLGPVNLGRDFYIPSLTPVNGVAEDAQFDSHARQSRFRFTSTTDTAEGDKIVGVLEFDFLVTNNGNERISNSYVPRMRHAFIKYKNWTIGQTWTTFMDVAALPETVDFIGVNDATTFGRQAMVRYTSGGWDFALENPETTVTPFGGGSRIVSDDNKMPDVIARYTMNQDWGYIKVAGLLRQLAYNNGGDIDSTTSGYGISITSKINLDNGDDIRIMFNTGSGVGRYVGLNTSNGAVIDATGELEAIDTTGYAISYRHLWNAQMRSSVTFSALDIDNDASLTGLGVSKSTYSARVNLMYSPTKAITVGAEYARATRELESGAEGDLDRIQVMAKYAF